MFWLRTGRHLKNWGLAARQSFGRIAIANSDAAANCLPLRIHTYNIVLYCVQHNIVSTMMSTTMTIRLDPELKKRLDDLSQATHRSKSFLAAEALRDFVELNEWQIQEIKDGLEEADQGNFASDQEVGKVKAKWTAGAS